MIGEKLDVSVIAKIRHCANKGLILGTEKFRKQFEHLTGDSKKKWVYSDPFLRPHYFFAAFTETVAR